MSLEVAPMRDEVSDGIGRRCRDTSTLVKNGVLQSSDETRRLEAMSKNPQVSTPGPAHS